MPSPTVTAPRARRSNAWPWLLPVILLAVLALASDLRIRPDAGRPNVIDGPFASLLAASTDLGPARGDHVQLTAMLQDQRRPTALIGWANQHGLDVQWRASDGWAVVEGRPDRVADAFAVEVHDYRGQRGQECFPRQYEP